ncbi:unnamed protein product [Cuscuta europaea]|nr:unnamed protein product [Cuscuta europaea]
MLRIEDITWLSGQLILGLIGNFVTEVNGKTDDSVIRFNIKDSVISFQKHDLAVMCALKFGVVKPNISEELEGDIWTNYSGGKTTLTRADIQNALKNYKSTDDSRLTNDIKGIHTCLDYHSLQGSCGRQSMQ